jgi:hypothetical protein
MLFAPPQAGAPGPGSSTTALSEAAAGQARAAMMSTAAAAPRVIDLLMTQPSKSRER